MRLKSFLTATALGLSLTAAHAGSNTCDGTLTVGKEWTTIKGDLGDYAPDGCRFRTASRLGRRILAVCSDGGQCAIDIPLDKRSSTVTSITNVTSNLE